MTQEFGRIDWMPRLKVWKVVGYVGRKDVEVGRATAKETAIHILHDWHNSNIWVSRDGTHLVKGGKS